RKLRGVVRATFPTSDDRRHRWRKSDCHPIDSGCIHTPSDRTCPAGQTLLAPCGQSTALSPKRGQCFRGLWLLPCLAGYSLLGIGCARSSTAILTGDKVLALIERLVEDLRHVASKLREQACLELWVRAPKQ